MRIRLLGNDITRGHCGQRNLALHLAMAYTGRPVEELMEAIRLHPTINGTPRAWIKWMVDNRKFVLEIQPT